MRSDTANSNDETNFPIKLPETNGRVTIFENLQYVLANIKLSGAIRLPSCKTFFSITEN